MTLLGIDHGTRRSGIAIEIAWVALPRSIVTTELLIVTIHKLMEEYPISLIVVGRAPHLNSKTQSKQEQIQNQFSQMLAGAFPGVKIISHNEWFTTKQARFELERAGLPSDGPVDDISAAIILQDYIDTH